MTKYRIIANPTSGRGAGAQAIPQAQQALKAHGLDFDLACTEAPEQAAALAREAAAAGCEAIVALGGDGTVNEVINGLMEARQEGAAPCALGVLCIGRGNDFSFGVGIPTDLEAGCRALAENHRRVIDVGHVIGGRYPQGRYFGNGLGIGFDAAVGMEAAKITWISGFLNYFLAALKTILLYYRAPLVTIEYDDQTITKKSLMVSIMNGRRLGGGFMMAPEGRPDDGLFDLCIADQVSRARMFALIPHFMRGTQRTQKPIWMGRARRVAVTAIEGVLPAHLDGEMLCTDGQRLEIELLPGQLEIVCQRPEAEPETGP